MVKREDKSPNSTIDFSGDYKKGQVYIRYYKCDDGSFFSVESSMIHVGGDFVDSTLISQEEFNKLSNSSFRKNAKIKP